MWNTDRWLVDRTLAGNREAFGRLYDRHGPRVFHLLRRLTRGNVAEAEDLAQETFLTAYKTLANWRGEGAFSTWLCGIAVRQYSTAQRRDSRRMTTESLDDTLPIPEAPGGSSDPLAYCTGREFDGVVEEAILALPDLCREVFLLIRMEGLSYKETALLLDIPIGTVQSRLWRATQLLQVRLYPVIHGVETNGQAAVAAGRKPCPKEGTNHVVR